MNLLKICILAAITILAGSSDSWAKNPRVVGILGGTTNKHLHSPDVVLNEFLNTTHDLYDKPNTDPDNPREPTAQAKGKDLYRDYYLENRNGIKVYAFRPLSWYMVGYNGRAYWIDVLPNMKMYDYFSLVKNREAYIKNWDWEIYDEPGGIPIVVEQSELPKHRRALPPAEVLEKREHDGEMWFRVRVNDSQCYEFDRPAKTIIKGWIPAYASNNDHAVWFEPRPCN